jgi:hypothetical protein
MRFGLRARVPRGLLALAASAALTFAFAGTASAATFTVNDNSDAGDAGVSCGSPTHSTIQAAVTAAQENAEANDVVSVCEGTYNEVVTITEDGLTLNGAQAGNDARSRSFADESLITGAGAGQGGVSVGGNNVVVDGFSIEDGDSPSVGAGMYTLPSKSGYVIRNNRFRSNVFGLYLHANGTNPTQVTKNAFDTNNDAGSASGSGIYSDQGASAVTVELNDFTGHTSAAVNFAGTQSNIAIQNNELTDDASIVGFSGTNGLDIVGNESTNPNGSAIFLGGGNTNVDVTGNDLDDSGDDTGTGTGDGPKDSTLVAISNAVGANTNVLVEDNVLTNGLRGVNVANGGSAGTLAVNKNRIVGNITGLRNQQNNLTVNAENNWWGCSAGPGGTGCDVVSNTGTSSATDSDPRLVVGLSANPASINVGGQTSMITADMSKNSAGQTVVTDLFDGLSIAFGTSLGSIQSPKTIGGTSATTTLTSGAAAGTANVTATLDGGTDTTQVTIVDPNAGGGGTGGGDTGGGDTGDGGGTQQQDGGATEVADTLIGTTADDVINGLAGDDSILGGVGDDLLQGGDGADDVKGGVGDDEVGGGAGPDDVSGGEGNDIVKGGPGPDTLDGGGGEDDISGGRGQDQVTANDGEKDVINCGANVDDVDADEKDDVSSNCENVS